MEQQVRRGLKGLRETPESRVHKVTMERPALRERREIRGQIPQ